MLVRSYRTVSPLPVLARPRRTGSGRAIGGLFSVALSIRSPCLALASTVPYGVPTFLDSVVRANPHAVPRSPVRLTVAQAVWRTTTWSRHPITR